MQSRLLNEKTNLAHDWSRGGAPGPKVRTRILGAVEPSEEKHSTRSIFNDIAMIMSEAPRLGRTQRNPLHRTGYFYSMGVAVIPCTYLMHI
jgi:hypothetical protein